MAPLVMSGPADRIVGAGHFLNTFQAVQAAMPPRTIIPSGRQAGEAGFEPAPPTHPRQRVWPGCRLNRRPALRHDQGAHPAPSVPGRGCPARRHAAGGLPAAAMEPAQSGTAQVTTALPPLTREREALFVTVPMRQTLMPNSFSAFRNAIFSLSRLGRSTARNQSVPSFMSANG